MCFTNVCSFVEIPLTVLKFKRTQNSIANDRREITQKIQSRVMVFVHDKSSECALPVYEVSLKYL